jgi:hypothetical protein
MSTKYLLPCDCGARLEVDATESGLTKACKCGVLLEVPTLRGLNKLEKVTVADAAPSRHWGARQRGIAVGAIVAVLGIALGLYAAFALRVTPRDFHHAERMPIEEPMPDEVPPAQLMQFWNFIVEPEGLRSAPPEIVARFHRTQRIRFWWMSLGFGIGLIGLAIMGASVYSGRGQKSRETRVERREPKVL